MAVTTQDRVLAAALLKAFQSSDTSDAINEIAKVLDCLHERAISCAMIRIERRAKLRKRLLQRKSGTNQ